MKRVLCIFFVLVLLMVSVSATSGADPVVNQSADPIEEVTIEDETPAPDVSAEIELDEPSSDPEPDPIETGTEYSGSDGDTAVLEEDPAPEEVVIYDESNPVPVIVVPEEASYSSFALYAGNGPVLVIGDEAPEDPPFYGCGYITGTSSTLGTVTLYFPNSYLEGYFGVDQNGYLVNVSSGSISGYLEGVYNNSVSVPSFSYPRYRTASNYDYTYVYLKPTSSNMEIATDFTGRVQLDELLPYVMILLLGVILICFMKRW